MPSSLLSQSSRVYVGITSRSWLSCAANVGAQALVNFWRPSGARGFSVLKPGELFLFKLHAPEHFIVGSGVFHGFASMSIREAWSRFGLGNGVASLEAMRRVVGEYARIGVADVEHRIGCIVLSRVREWDERSWLRAPRDWSNNIVQGRSYPVETEIGGTLLRAAIERDPGLISSDQDIHELLM